MEKLKLIAALFLGMIIATRYIEITTPIYNYQLEATPYGYELYSNGEKIGFIPAGNSKLDSLIINNNQ